MECVHCGAAGFNRVVVDLGAAGDQGGLCSECERERYGRVLTEPLWQRADGCLLCAAAGEYALPLLECHIEHDDGDSVEYTLDDRTPLLCTEHAAELLPVVAETPEAPNQVTPEHQ